MPCGCHLLLHQQILEIHGCLPKGSIIRCSCMGSLKAERTLSCIREGHERSWNDWLKVTTFNFYSQSVCQFALLVAIRATENFNKITHTVVQPHSCQSQFPHVHTLAITSDVLLSTRLRHTGIFSTVYITSRRIGQGWECQNLVMLRGVMTWLWIGADPICVKPQPPPSIISLLSFPLRKLL
jgi:hypothetical protein